MANINLKYPDGRLEERELLTAISKDGLNIAVVNLDNVVNGNKVTGVMLLSDGFYQNIVDDIIWKNITQILIDSIHGNLLDNDYQKLEGEVNVTADPYRQLALRDGNYDSLVQNYSNAMAKLVVDNKVALESNDDNSLESSTESFENTGIQEENVSAETPLAPDYGEIKDIETVTTTPISSEEPVATDNQAINTEGQFDMNGKASMNVGEGIFDSQVAPMSEENQEISEPVPEAVSTTPITETPVQNEVQFSGVPENNLTPDVANMPVDTPVSLESTPEVAPTTPITDVPVQDNVFQFPSTPDNNLTPDVANMPVDAPVSLEPTPEAVPTTPINETPVQDNDLVAAIEQVYEEAKNEINGILEKSKVKTFEILKNGLNNTKTENPIALEENGPVLELNKAA